MQHIVQLDGISAKQWWRMAGIHYYVETWMLVYETQHAASRKNAMWHFNKTIPYRSNGSHTWPFFYFENPSRFFHDYHFSNRWDTNNLPCHGPFPYIYRKWNQCTNFQIISKIVSAVCDADNSNADVFFHCHYFVWIKTIQLAWCWLCLRHDGQQDAAITTTITVYCERYWCEMLSAHCH